MFEKLIEAACKYYNITDIELVSNQDRETVYRRKIVIKLARQHTNMTYKKIANRFNLKDGSWMYQIAQEIESTRIIYPHISQDLKNVMYIVDTLV